MPRSYKLVEAISVPAALYLTSHHLWMWRRLPVFAGSVAICCEMLTRQIATGTGHFRLWVMNLGWPMIGVDLYSNRDMQPWKLRTWVCGKNTLPAFDPVKDVVKLKDFVTRLVWDRCFDQLDWTLKLNSIFLLSCKTLNQFFAKLKNWFLAYEEVVGIVGFLIFSDNMVHESH